MLHADVAPPDFWLETLIEEMERKGLDLLSVAVPIKDTRGLTSTALGHPGEQDYYRCFCRLTLAELYKLPETFTAETLGHPGRPLLVNTGCFVCKFDWRWAEGVVFQDLNRIRFDGQRYVKETFPEDWHFARQLWQLGLKVGATRKVTVDHRGQEDFSSAGPWGNYDDFDREYLKAPAVEVPAGPPGGWAFPFEVGGWLTEAEGRTLAELAEGRRVLEVGSYLGRSTICLARKAKSVDCVDPFDGRATPELRHCRDEFADNLSRHGVGGKVLAHVGTFADVAPHLGPADFDLIFIDADHSYEAVSRDIALALPLLRPGGLIAFHDYGNPADPGVAWAVDEFLAGGARLLARVDSLALVRPAAAEAAVPTGGV
jgi:SAM-dependent methyltransferase